MHRLIWILALMVALLQVTECSNREGNHNRFKRMRRDVNFLQDKLIQINHPEPILDTAKPSELCCNTKQHNIGIAFVNGYDAASGALVNLVEFPKRASNQVGKGITRFLDMIGGRLVGLQK